MRPKEVAGVPPDYFSADGQLWGNPLYDWKKQQSDGFLWWHHRLLHQLQFFDKIRIDHFRAFESYYAVPYGATTAKIGRGVKGVGTKIFDGLDLDDRIIAEDLGIITDKVRRLAGRAFLDFPVNETAIYPDYRRNPDELRRINNTIDSALFDKTIQVRSISLHGYASPESPYANNTRLAKGRTAALMGYIQNKYGLPAAVFHTDFTPEDWQNLRSFIADGDRRRVKGDIWYESAVILETPAAPDIVLRHREELLAIIDRAMDPDEKESLLKQVGGGEPYKWLLKHVYPGLRHTDYIIEYAVRDYSDADARKLIYTHPEALSHMEMYRVAQGYETGSDDWRDALLIAAARFPEDPQANYNAACACIQARRLQDARKYLQKAGTGEQAQYLKNVIDAMEGKVKWTLGKDNYLEILK